MKIFSPTIINNFTASIGVVQGISGSQFSGSFIGNGYGLTGIVSASVALKTLQSLTTISTSTYTLKTSDWNQALKFDSGSGIIVVTIPSSSVSSSAAMDFVDSFQWNAARVQFTTASNFITLRSSNGLYTRTTGSACSRINMGTDQWLLTGDLATT